MSSPRIVIVGAGIGGLTTAALLTNDGCDVTVLEAQTYPGGSASTFYHQGYRFDSGATVAGGFQANGPHAVLARLLDIDWPIHQHDPAWVVHLPDYDIFLMQDYAEVLKAFPAAQSFWTEQRAIADIAWSLATQGLPWPPTDVPELLHLMKTGLINLPGDLRLLPFALTTVQQWMRRRGLADDVTFRRFIDASLLISAQASSDQVNAVYGATALDLARQGVYHVAGGIGGIAEALVKKIRLLGGRVLYRQRVKQILVENGRAVGVRVSMGRHSQTEETLPADFVIANTTPWSLDQLLGEGSPRKLRREVDQRAATQGAFVLHLGIDADNIPRDIPDHHQIVNSLRGPMGEGETLFVSISPEWDSSRAPAGKRAVTVSTHTAVQQWWDALNTSEADYYARKEAYAARMIESIDRVIPGFKPAVRLCLPGTPVTYQFYTSRYRGMVGGFPQTSLFRARGPRTGISNLRMVGDSIFPGQSTAGVTLGGMRVTADVRRHLHEGRAVHAARHPLVST